MANDEQSMYAELLKAYGQAWNRHDVDALVSMMTPDCVFVLSAGAHPWGERAEGAEAVRQAFQSLLDNVPNAHWNESAAFVCGDRGVTQWRFTGTTRDGVQIDVDGTDLYTFRDGKIQVKNAFRKAVAR